MTRVRVALPAHLRALAHVVGEVKLEVAGPLTVTTVLDALESRYPMLRGTIRHHGTDRRRAYMRFFACGNDLSHEPPDTLLPDCVSSGDEVFCVIGAIPEGNHPTLTIAFSDSNRVTWFVCLGPSSDFCDEFIERGLVTFQRAGRKDVVLARDVGPAAVSDPESAREAFLSCGERLWTTARSRERYRIEIKGHGEHEQGAYRVTSRETVHVTISARTKPVGLLTDVELEGLVRKAFGEDRS